MTYRVGTQDISRGEVHFPWTGVWSLEATLAGDKAPPAAGTAVTVFLGEVTANGVVRSSGIHVGRPEIQVIGGLSDGWGKTLPLRYPYRSPTGIKLKLVVEDLAKDVGERVEVSTPLQDYVLGYAWSRPAMRASDSLATLRVNGAPVPWHVQLNGTTYIGERPTATPAVEYIPGKVWVSQESAEVSTPTDSLTTFLPGTILTIEGLPLRPIRQSTLMITDSKAKAIIYL